MSRPAQAAVVAALAAVAAALTAVASRSGIGLTWDSVAYLYAARAVADGSAPQTMTGEAFTHFPAGLPVLLGSLARLGPDVQTVGTVLGVALVATLVVTTYAVGATALADRTLALVPTGLVAVATPVVMLHSRLWSEPLTCLLTALLLLLLARGARAAHLTWPALAGIVVLVWLAPWIRYASIVLVGVAAVGATVAWRRRGIVRALAGGVLVGLTASLGTVALLVYNVVIDGRLFGPRTPPQGTVPGYLVDTLTTLGALVVPVPVADRLPITATLAGLVVAALLAYGTVRVVRRRDPAMAVLVTFVALYWLFVLVSGRISFVEFMRYRIAAPAFVPLAVIAAYAGRELLGRTWGGARRGVGVALAGLLLLAGPVALAQSAAYAWTVGSHGHGYADRAVTASPLAAAVAALPADAAVSSNDPLAVYAATGLVVPRYTPRSTSSPAGSYLAVFDATTAGTTRAAANPATGPVPVVLVETFADGRLFRVS